MPRFLVGQLSVLTLGRFSLILSVSEAISWSSQSKDVRRGLAKLKMRNRKKKTNTSKNVWRITYRYRLRGKSRYKMNSTNLL